MTEWSFLKKDADHAAFYNAVASLGIDGAELVNKSRYEVARSAGLKIINRGGPGKWNRAENHPQCMIDLQASIDDAVKNDIPAIFVFSGNREGQADSVSIDHCVTGLAQAARLAEQHDKMLMLEVFNKFDHPDYAADSSEFAYEVVRQVGSKNLTVLYDIYHMLKMSENVSQTLMKHLDLVGHIHIARSPDRKIATDEVSINLLKELDSAGYRGYVGAEWLADQPIEELKAFMDQLRS